jgi:hypothetical protein
VARQTPQQRTLRRAAETLGGVEHLSQVLQATPAHVASWISGEAPVPTKIYLAALDIVARGPEPTP